MNIKYLMIKTINLSTLMFLSVGFTHAVTDTWLPNDNTVIDFATGLICQRQDDGVVLTYAEAIVYCESLSLDNSNDWRLPYIKELVSILDHRRDQPAIDRTAFINSEPTSRYWTTSSNASNLNDAWYVLFGAGQVVSDSKLETVYVRCVR